LKLPVYLLEYVRAFCGVFMLTWRLRPRAIIGFGSYGSVPGVLAGFILRIPILLHEQNLVAGFANQFLAKFAARIASSFPEVIGFGVNKRVFCSGYPVRKSFFEESAGPKTVEKPKAYFEILIFGGSQGSEAINKIFLDTLELLSPEERKQIAVTHIVGNKEIDLICARYQTLEIRNKVIAFSDQIAQHLKNSDLVISRAGAGSIFEIAVMKRQAILIPYPHAYGHQKMNARYLAERSAGFAIEEEHLSAGFLKDVILRIEESGRMDIKMEESLGKFVNQDASKTVAEMAFELQKESE
jgi:UDP-N-acetylglucosamine--N-acetylmuramyl-(pentapeptide) pyrophosphoryl-undecaprenol N-acetylglucosamine transferase